MEENTSTILETQVKVGYEIGNIWMSHTTTEMAEEVSPSFAVKLRMHQQVVNTRIDCEFGHNMFLERKYT